MSHSGCIRAKASQHLISHSPLSLDWSSEGDHTIRRTDSPPFPVPVPPPQPPRHSAAITGSSTRASSLRAAVRGLHLLFIRMFSYTSSV